jgi:hypothetical protein
MSPNATEGNGRGALVPRPIPHVTRREGTHETVGLVFGKLSDQEPVERLAREQANFDDPQSPDFEHWNQLVGAAPPKEVQDAMARVLQRIDPQAYYEHVTPGMRGSEHLGGLGGGARGASQVGMGTGGHREEDRSCDGGGPGSPGQSRSYW